MFDSLGVFLAFFFYCIVGVWVGYTLINLALLAIWTYRLVDVLFVRKNLPAFPIWKTGILLVIAFALIGTIWKSYLEPIGLTGDFCKGHSWLATLFPLIGIVSFIRLVFILPKFKEKDRFCVRSMETYFAFIQLVGCLVSVFCR